MKKTIALLLTITMMLSCTVAFAEPDYQSYTQWPVSEEKIEMKLTIPRNDAYGVDADQMWFWNFVKKYSGLDIEIEQISEDAISERKSLMFASGDLPDVLYGIKVTTDEIVQYGAEEGMLMDLSPYITEDIMPNLCKLLEVLPEGLALCTCFDGKVYTLPVFGRLGVDGNSDRSFIDYALLQELGLEIPKTLDELVDALYAMKAYDADLIPLGGSQNAFNPSYYLLNAMGYLGAGYNDGTGITVRDGKAVIPATDELFVEFLKLMNRFYTDGIISQDFYTIDSTTVNAQMAEGKLGLYPFVPYTVTPEYDDYSHWESVYPLTSEYNDTPKWVAADTISNGSFVMSAECKNPEAILRAFDGFYALPISVLTWFGPMYEEGVGGWIWPGQDMVYLDEKGEPYTELLAYNFKFGSGTSEGIKNEALTFVEKYDSTPDSLNAYCYDLYNQTMEGFMKDGTYNDEHGDGNFRNSMKANITPYETTGYPSIVYMSEDDTYRVAELESVLVPYMQSEIAKFITGMRSLDTFDAYLEECRDMGSDELNDIYDKYYQDYLENTK